MVKQESVHATENTAVQAAIHLGVDIGIHTKFVKTRFYYMSFRAITYPHTGRRQEITSLER